jgi:hypothetical protein
VPTGGNNALRRLPKGYRLYCTNILTEIADGRPISEIVPGPRLAEFVPPDAANGADLVKGTGRTVADGNGAAPRRKCNFSGPL